MNINQNLKIIKIVITIFTFVKTVSVLSWWCLQEIHIKVVGVFGSLAAYNQPFDFVGDSNAFFLFHC